MSGWGELILAGVVAPLLVAAVLGVVKSAGALVRWGAEVTRALSKLAELVDDVRDLTASVRDLSDVRAELRAHVALAEDRWHSLIPEPRHQPADPRRARARAVVLGQ